MIHICLFSFHFLQPTRINQRPYPISTSSCSKLMRSQICYLCVVGMKTVDLIAPISKIALWLRIELETNLILFLTVFV